MISAALAALVKGAGRPSWDPSGLAGCHGADLDGVDLARQVAAQGAVHQLVPLDPAERGEGRRDHMDPEMVGGAGEIGDGRLGAGDPGLDELLDVVLAQHGDRLRRMAHGVAVDQGRLGLDRPGDLSLAGPEGAADTAPPRMRVLLCRPRGFCAGVERAIEVVERALAKFGAPIYVRHEIVHNKVVVESLREKGAVFVDELADVPSGAHVIFSAHGVAPSVFAEADRLSLTRIDATCPLVTKVHAEARRFAREGVTILLIGHREHVEVIGVVGEAPDRTIVVSSAKEAWEVRVPDPDRVGVLTQTTLSVDEMNAVMNVLRQRFPKLRTPRKEDICYATTNRQMAVKQLDGQVDLWLVIGDPASSNSNRLREIAASQGVAAYLLLGPDQLDPRWLDGVETVGVTSGASTPEVSVERVVDRLRELGATEVRNVDGASETVEFTLPVELR